MAHFFHHHHASHPAASSSSVFAPPTPHHYSSSHARPRPAAQSTSSTSRYPSQVPSRVASQTTIDPILEYYSRASHPAIEFDLSLPPSQILISHGSARSSFAGLSSRQLSLPATEPSLPYLRIRCEEIPWSIDVYPSSRTGSNVVTVGDVLDGIYRSLRHRVSGTEWYSSSYEMQQRVRHAWQRRCKRQQSRDERAYETSNGLRRIDWLAKNTMFQGLSPGKSRDHWIMHVAHAEKTVKFWAGS